MELGRKIDIIDAICSGDMGLESHEELFEFCHEWYGQDTFHYTVVARRLFISVGLREVYLIIDDIFDHLVKNALITCTKQKFNRSIQLKPADGHGSYRFEDV